MQEDGEWKCVHREYTSRRKNREMVLFRFIPAHPNIEVWDKEIPEMSQDNLCVNGDCENVITGKGLEQRKAYYKKIEASDFYQAPGRLFPMAWWLGVLKAVNGESAEMALTDVNPIAGKYSLEMGTNHIKWGLNSSNTTTTKQDCTFFGFVRAESDALIKVYSCYWDIDQKKTGFIDTYTYQLYSGKTYRFSFPVRKDDVPEEDKNIYIIVSGSGHVLLDNVEFIPKQ